MVDRTEQGIVKEDPAGFETSGHLIHPSIIKGHELRLVRKTRWLDIFPKVG